MDTIMLKTQLLATLINNCDFNNWLANEKNGYTETESIPEYRQLKCHSIKADIATVAGSIWSNYEIPIDAISASVARLAISTIPFSEPVSVLEALVNHSDKQDDSRLSVSLPASVFPYIDAALEGIPHNTIKAWRVVSAQAVKGIIERIKSNLLDMILQLNTELDLNLDPSSLEQEKITQIVNTTIYANNIHTGNGNIIASDCPAIIGDNANQIITSDVKQQIQELIDQISQLKEHVENDEEELVEYLMEIQQELDKKISSPKILRKCLRALKSFSGIVAEKAVELNIDKIIGMLPIG